MLVHELFGNLFMPVYEFLTICSGLSVALLGAYQICMNFEAPQKLVWALFIMFSFLCV